MLVELTISYETNFDDAAERKEVKYEELITGARASGFDTELITLEVGSRRVINPAGFKRLKHSIPAPPLCLNFYFFFFFLYPNFNDIVNNVH